MNNGNIDDYVRQNFEFLAEKLGIFEEMEIRDYLDLSTNPDALWLLISTLYEIDHREQERRSSIYEEMQNSKNEKNLKRSLEMSRPSSMDRNTDPGSVKDTFDTIEPIVNPPKIIKPPKIYSMKNSGH